MQENLFLYDNFLSFHSIDNDKKPQTRSRKYVKRREKIQEYLNQLRTQGINDYKFFIIYFISHIF